MPLPHFLIALLLVAGPAAAGGFENRVWIDEGADAPPGSLRAFLADGSLVMTSCVENYRLARWQRVDADTVAWDENGMPITAQIEPLGPDRIALTLDLVGGSERRTLRAASEPAVCPDLPR